MDKKKQLAAVKYQLYHPRLPTLRKMDMDTVSHLLSTEHSRHTTLCSKADFTKIRTTRYPSVPLLHCKETAEGAVKNQIASYKPLENKRLYHTSSAISDICDRAQGGHTLRWKETLNQINSPSTSLTNDSNNNNIKGTATIPPGTASLYYVRKIHPEIASSWKTALLVKDQPQSSFVATHKPMPATIFSRYRNTRRPYSAYPWY